MKSTSGFSGLVGFKTGQNMANKILPPPSGNNRSIMRYPRRATGENEFQPFDEKELVKGYLLFLAVFFTMLKLKEILV